jgi:hypothetical protein
MPSSRNTLTCTPTSAAAFACELRAVVREVLLRPPPPDRLRRRTLHLRDIPPLASAADDVEL